MTPPASPDVRRQTLVAMALTAAAYFMFNIGDALLKLIASRDLHFSQIMVVNCSFIIVFTFVFNFFRDGQKAFKVQSPKLIVMRALFSAGTGVMNLLAMPHIKLTTFYTLVFTSPFWVALLAAVFLKEKLVLSRILVIVAGFSAVAFVFRPGAGLFDKYAVMILIGAFFYSCGLVIMRRMGPKESRPSMIIVGSLVSIAVVLPIFPEHYRPMDWHEWGLFLAMGSLSSISVTCIAYAFQTAPAASVIAPFHYTQIIWGALLGYLIFNEVPDDRVILAAGIIIGAGLYLIFSETRKKKKDPVPLPETAAPP